MNNISDDIIIYKLNNYLDIIDKANLKLVNKKFYQLESKSINFHIGTLIANYLGFNYKCNQDKKLLAKSPIEFIKIISNYLLNDLDINIKKKTDMYYIFPLGITLKINSSNIDECKEKLKQPKIFRQYDTVPNKAPTYLKNTYISNKIYHNNRHFLKYFPNVYAII